MPALPSPKDVKIETPAAAAPVPLYGVLGEFADEHALLEAAGKVYRAGYRHADAFSPVPVEGLAEALGRKRSWVPPIVLCGGLGGASLGYFTMWFSATIDYPFNIGGRPFHSWPMFIPITFEMGILGAALSGVAAMFALNRLPRLHHPLFAVPGFERATVDRYFLCLEAKDKRFGNAASARRFLEGVGAVYVVDVPQ